MADKNIKKGVRERGRTVFESEFFYLSYSTGCFFVEIKGRTFGKILHIALSENKDFRVTAGT